MDIDLDTKSDFKPAAIFKDVTLASMLKGGELVRHPCGTYFQNIAHDPITNYAAIPHKEAQDLGYFKVDFLHLSLLDDFDSKAEIRALMKQEPDWNLLLDEDHVAKLFHIKLHYAMINRIKPRSIQVLADAIALIRPGRRRLLDQYLQDPKYVRDNLLYVKNAEDEYSFKRGHALAYAINIVLQLHLIKQGKL